MRAQVLAQRHLHELEIEQVGRLGERRVRRPRHDDPAALDSPLRARLVPRRLHGHEDRLGTAGRHRAASLIAAVQQIADDADALALHLLQRRKDERVKGVLQQRVAARRLQQRIDLRPRVVDQRPRARVVVVGVVHLHRAQLRHHVVNG